MATKIITVSATPPAESTGSDHNKGAPLNASEFDQNLVNIKAAVDRKTTNSSAAITGGAIDGTTIGATTPASGGFTTINVSDSVTLPASTSIGSVSSAEIGYLDGVTSAIQTQLNNKAAEDAVVKITGDQAIAGAKTFGSSVITQGFYMQRNRIDTDMTIPDGYNAVMFGDFELGPDTTITCLGNATFTAIG